MLKKQYLNLVTPYATVIEDRASVEPLAKPMPVEPVAVPVVEPYVAPKMDVTCMVRPKTNIDIAKAKKIAEEIYSDYGRKILISIADITRGEMEIRHDIKTFMYGGVRQMLFVPDFSPTDARLHYHGVVNITSYRDFSKSISLLRKYVGNVWVKTGSKKNMDYLFKIYERNSKTPPGTILEAINNKQIILKYR